MRLSACRLAASPVSMGAGAEHTRVTGFSLRDRGYFLYRLLRRLWFNSRVAGSHTRPLRGESYWLVLHRVFKRPAFTMSEQRGRSLLNDLCNDLRMTAMCGVFQPARSGVGL